SACVQGGREVLGFDDMHLESFQLPPLGPAALLVYIGISYLEARLQRAEQIGAFPYVAVHSFSTEKRTNYRQIAAEDQAAAAIRGNLPPTLGDVVAAVSEAVNDGHVSTLA